MTAWPVDAVPDGHVAAPHHVYLGLGVLLVVAWVVADDLPHREPVVSVAGALVALFAFGLVWPWYPVVGAAGAVAGVVVALAGVVWPGGMWSTYSSAARALAGVGALVALDDVVEHAFGWATPLDLVWVRVVYPALPST
ncbi:hypothetical protein [Halobacterium litoreum]|uniref:Uncharacterized protein n=1 Tax=Halobacterium litoreum TaxID=2039234 RepID=A0ABD5NAH4_9EURY|nr:hypothetical protein [Halobacterium litoreum]UHH14875.1 hypothetical protein LT972_14810 [Halobacterium litoreum]